MKKLVAAIAEQPFAEGLSPEHLQIVAGCAMETYFAEGQVIFGRGDLANRFYLIQTGLVALELPASGGKWLKVQAIGPGQALGWSWLFEPYRWHFRARALEPTTAIFFYGTRLRAQCEEDSALGYELVKRIARVAIKRLESAQAQLIASGLADSEDKLPRTGKHRKRPGGKTPRA
jgi:CRP-like cAMP-binding protein